jgi:hypothetical protein
MAGARGLSSLLAAAKPATLAAAAVVLLGLGLRVYAAWDVNQFQPDTRARLYADEPGYDNLARGS